MPKIQINKKKTKIIHRYKTNVPFFLVKANKKIHKSTRILLNFSQSLPLTCNYLSLSVSINISVSFTICFYLFLYVCLCCLKLILCLSICSPFNFANWQQTYKFITITLIHLRLCLFSTIQSQLQTNIYIHIPISYIYKVLPIKCCVKRIVIAMQLPTMKFQCCIFVLCLLFQC